MIPIYEISLPELYRAYGWALPRLSKPVAHNRLGVRGVRKKGNRYHVRIRVYGIKKHVGHSKNLTVAGYLYQIARAFYYRPRAA